MSAVRTGSLGRRLSLWLALQSLCGFMVVCAAVYMDARSNLADRQIEALAGKRAQIGHLVAESYGDDNLAGLKHKLDDLFVGHDEVSLSIRDPKGQALYTSESASSARGRPRTPEFDVPVAASGRDRLYATLALDTREDDQLLRRLGLTLLFAAVGGALLASLAGYWIVRMGLAPVQMLGEQARGLRHIPSHTGSMAHHNPRSCGRWSSNSTICWPGWMAPMRSCRASTRMSRTNVARRLRR